jgi:gamma-glutamyl-gamma-aminobutyrate hydrolase PuuD
MKTIALPIGVEDKRVAINKAYVDYVLKAGFVPMLISPASSEVLTAQMQKCDGLLLPGGIDIDPMYYGDNNHASYSVDPAKDSFERELFWYFINNKKPVFGICRGLQLVAREFIATNFDAVKDTLVFGQHIGDHTRNTNLQVARSIPTHFVEAYTSLLYSGAVKGDISWKPVNSMHHQYLHCNLETKVVKNKPIVELPDKTRLIITAYTREGLAKNELGVVIEGFIIPSWKVACVQWHPEELEDFALIKNFFEKGIPDGLVLGSGHVIK